MLDLDPGLVLGAGHEADLDLGRIRAVAVEVPGVGQPGGWLPDRHLAPVMLDAARLPLEDPAAGPALQDDRQAGRGRDGVVERPPKPDPPGPRLEGMLDRAVELERQPDRLDHRGGRGTVFVATSRNRSVASPQTRSTYARTASTPSSWSS